jgi:hypothetical protein
MLDAEKENLKTLQRDLVKIANLACSTSTVDAKALEKQTYLASHPSTGIQHQLISLPKKMN